MSAITPDLVAAHQLSDAEHQKIVSLLGRESTPRAAQRGL